MLIAIPSKGRPNNCPSYERLEGNCVLFVPESEFHQYKTKYKNVISIPISVKGITQTRNWILKNTDERWVVMIDDDVKYAGYNLLLDTKCKKVEIKESDIWVQEFKKLFSITEQFNYKIWGIKTESAPMSTYPYKPFLFKSYVTASCMGIINDKSYYFDENFIVKEDYEICLRHISEFGGIIAARYLHWENSHWEDDGGCKDYRTQKVEEDSIKLLKSMYPNLVSGVTRKNNKYTIKLSL
jgi:hypothetical protein